MLDDDLLNDGQTQAGAVCLRCVKRHEDFRQRLGGYAATVVGDKNPLALPLAALLDFSADDHAAAGGIVGGGFGGVAREVEQGLAQQGIVARYVGKISAYADGSAG